ncbi:MAG: hypothetical protein ACYDHX_03310 [Methanothrix sp.]
MTTLRSLAENIIMSWSSPCKREEAQPMISFRTVDLAHVITRESCEVRQELTSSRAPHRLTG